MNIGALLPRHARYRPDHLALVVGDQRLTYQELNAVVNRLANALLASGIAKGEKIATVLPNCLELMTAYWAAAKTGIVIVPMSTLMQDHGLATLLVAQHLKGSSSICAVRSGGSAACAPGAIRYRRCRTWPA